MTTAMIRALRHRFPSATIDMIVREDFLDLIRENPHLTHAIGLRRSDGLRGVVQLVRTINRSNYDVIYDAHRSLRTLVMMPLLRARLKFYYRKQYVRRNLSLIFKIPLWGKPKRFLEKFIEPLAPLGVAYDHRGPELFLPNHFASPMPPGFGPSVVGLIPSAQWPGKRWPEDRFRQLLIKLMAETDSQFIVFGGHGDHFCRSIVKDLSADRVFNAQGKWNLMQSGKALSECQYVIANDTGLMHMADALGIPSVLIFGPTSADLGCKPFDPRSQIVEKALWCRPCSKNGQALCIRAKRYCLLNIMPDDVLLACRKVQSALAAGP